MPRSRFVLDPGEDPQYASSYDTIPGGPVDVTQYYGESGVDIDKSMKLAELRKAIGPAMDNKIMGIWNRYGAEDPYGTYRYGPNKMMLAQDEFLKDYGPMLGVRDTHKQAKKNPMLF